ncbi:MAG: CBS domain-containing protein [Rhodospirillales bacterium]|nr:CBS domain-containing protein [Rhodospirillales bacterium]
MLMRIADISVGNGVSIEASASVAAAALHMRDQGVDRLVVVEDGRIVGSLGDREIIIGCISKRRLPSRVLVGDIMSAAAAAAAVTVEADASLQGASLEAL